MIQKKRDKTRMNPEMLDYYSDFGCLVGRKEKSMIFFLSNGIFRVPITIDPNLNKSVNLNFLVRKNKYLQYC